MKRSLIAVLAVLAVAGFAFAQFTDVDSPQYHGKTSIPKLTAAIDANNALLEATSGTAGTGATATERPGPVKKTTIACDDVVVITAEGGTGTNGVGSAKIYDFPAGRISVLGVLVENFTVTVDTNALDAADGGDFSLGTAAAGGASGLASTEVDLCPSTSIDPITNVTDSALGAAAQFDGTATAKDLYINLEVDDADIAADATNTVDATVTVWWINLGDY